MKIEILLLSVSILSLIRPTPCEISTNIKLKSPSSECLIYYYGYWQNRNITWNTASVVSNCETVFDGNLDNPPISIPGAKTAIRIKPTQFNYTFAVSLLTHVFVHILMKISCLWYVPVLAV